MNKKLFIITITIGLVVAVISLTLILLYNTDQRRSQNEEISITPTPYPVSQGKILRENVPYNDDAKRKLIDIIQQRPELSDQGKIVRQNLLARLNNISGIVSETSTYRLEYIESPDTFMSEILTTDIEQAKKDVETFLLQEGFSRTDICYLPLTFYLNYSVSRSLRETNTEFSPLPLGC